METQEFDEELQETNRIYKEIGDLSTVVVKLFCNTCG